MECKPLCLCLMREMQLHVQPSSWELWPQPESPAIILWEVAWSQQQPLKRGYKTNLVETGLPETPPKPWSFSQQQEDGQLYTGVFQSCSSRGGSWPLLSGKLLSLTQLCSLHSVFTNFKQINLNAEQMNWRWYLGRCFCICFSFFPLSSEVKI